MPLGWANSHSVTVSIFADFSDYRLHNFQFNNFRSMAILFSTIAGIKAGNPFFGGGNVAREPVKNNLLHCLSGLYTTRLRSISLHLVNMVSTWYRN